MNRILISLAIIGAVSAIVIGGTISYFSDTETSSGNTFTAGVIDISIDDQNPWDKSFTMRDMKPCDIEYITFKVQNQGSGANPVDVYKKITVTQEDTGEVTEPECTEQGGTWDNENCNWNGHSDNDDLSSVIWYDLSVEVYDSNGNKIWHQIIYTDDDKKSIDDIYGNDKEVYLGMIPAGGYMIVKQSYHLDPNAGNEYQGDKMTFNIQVRGEQLHEARVLENKDPNSWKLLFEDEYKGSLSYKTKGPTFDFNFDGKVPLSNTKYCLWIGGTPQAGNWDADTKVACAMSNSDKTISFSGNIELNKDVKNGKAWLIPETDYDGSWKARHPENYLWETGLIWYEDTDLQY